jgi:alkaline phosphatase D
MAITLGLAVGHTTATTVKIWMRGEAGPRHSNQEYCYGAVDLLRGRQVVASRYCHLKDYHDFTGVVTFEGLQPGTAYTARATAVYHTDASAPPIGQDLPGPIALAPDAVGARFFTADPAAEQLRFVFGSCRYLYWDNFIHSDAAKGDKAFRSIRDIHSRKPLDFLLMVGDQIYADPLNVLHQSRKLSEFYDIYRKTFEQPQFRALLGELPSYMILDDHEIQDNWSKDMTYEGMGGFFETAMIAYQSYQHLRNPDTGRGRYWYTFSRGVFPFFVMDTRTQRIRKPEGMQEKTMLGREQLNDFLHWLHDSRRAPTKFVVSSVPLVPDTKKGTDKWAEYAAERSTILEFLRLEKIRNVVFLSGDVHNTSFARMRCHQDPGFRLTSLVSSPFYWPYPHEMASDFYTSRTVEYMQWAERTRRGRDRIEYRYEGEGFIGDESYVLVDVDLARGRRSGHAEIMARKGGNHPDYPGVFEF